jgi:hypothetical protein
MIANTHVLPTIDFHGIIALQCCCNYAFALVKFSRGRLEFIYFSFSNKDRCGPLCFFNLSRVRIVVIQSMYDCERVPIPKQEINDGA